ncbi:multiheme c-type cytochrome [Pontibacter sp. G13]|uniref:multiheme c-type cytochrome n=1 Tax=Pontibacter sp. G13 TaxID=3074898 RepID=UPI00288999C7|nr:multiheme c-type cytochrome [Pontibacter sp. G13]WNJ17916.1 multiheme c-type cytochrome [Pontibacter sp. G13]
MESILKILAVIILVAEVILLLRLRAKRHHMGKEVRMIALFAIILIPIAAMTFANYHVFVGMKETQSCVNCHVMAPMGNDLIDKESQTLAARHYQNGWIREDACYTCHEDYGFSGTIKGKMDGYRHLMKYVTKTYKEPIRYRGEFNVDNCLKCHQHSAKFHAIQEHVPVLENIANERSISCVNCHGRAHPEPSRRTPGHPDYEQLETVPDLKNATVDAEQVKEIQEYLTTLEP